MDSAISIHAPLVGSDSMRGAFFIDSDEFQSTLPLWGATICGLSILKPLSFQSTLPLWGATNRRCGGAGRAGISIHAPLVGSDSMRSSFMTFFSRFQSTLPLWGATRRWGGCRGDWLFQSTLPLWGATQNVSQRFPIVTISIHAPLVGSDCKNRQRTLPGLAIFFAK